MEILYNVISSLVVVILALTAFIKFYIPKHDKANHDKVNHSSNPEYSHNDMTEIRNQLNRFNELMAVHSVSASERHIALLSKITSIDGRLVEIINGLNRRRE